MEWICSVEELVAEHFCDWFFYRKIAAIVNREVEGSFSLLMVT